MKTLEVTFDRFKDLLKENRDDALEVTMAAVKRHMANAWPHMSAANTDVVMLTIHELSCTTLCKSLEQPIVMTSDAEDNVPTRHQVLSKLPEQQNQRAVTEHCITLFDKMYTATNYISLAMVNLSSLVKLTNPKTFRFILEASMHPLVQLNIPENMLNPVRDKPPLGQKTHREKLQKVLLPNDRNTRLRRGPKNSATRLLTAAIYFKLKRQFLNEGTQPEMATKFD